MTNNIKISEEELSQSFYADVDRIALHLVEVYGLRFSQEVPSLSSPLLRWLDFRMRYVSPTPRRVVLSDRFPKPGLPTNIEAALAKFAELARSGGDLNPYQSKGLILRNDHSSDNRLLRTDLLWADWNIHHFHLTESIPAGDYFSARSDYLIFCIVEADAIGFIDVVAHPAGAGFSDHDLVEVAARSWPEYFDQYRLKTFTSERRLTKEDVHHLRKSGVNAPLVLNGDLYVNPGMGITSASTPVRVIKAHDHAREYTRTLASAIADPGLQISKELVTAGVLEPVLSLEASQHGLIVYEKASQLGFVLPRLTMGSTSGDVERLHDLLLPEWTVRHFAEAT